MVAGMSENTVRLVALERGFVNNRMVEPGAVFSYPADRKIPKWAAKEEDAKPVKEKPKGADLKPADTQAAVKKKMATIAGEQA